MTVFLAIVCICLLVPVLGGVALIMTQKVVFQKELPPTRKVIDAWVKEGPAPGYHRQWQDRLRTEWPSLANALDEASGIIPMVSEPIEDIGKRYERLAEQDWEHEFRKLNKGIPWNHKPRIGPPPTRKPLRKVTDPDGEIVELNSWQSFLDEEVICNPCARNLHHKCVVIAPNDNFTSDEYIVCYCDCLEDEDE